MGFRRQYENALAYSFDGAAIRVRTISEEFLNKVGKVVLLEHLVPEISKLLGERAAVSVSFKIIKDAARDSAKELGLHEMKELGDMCALFKYVYGLFGNKDVECIEEGDKLRIIVRNCPLIKMVKNDSNACLIAMALKVGIVEALDKDRVMIEVKGHKYGHPNPNVVVRRIKSVPEGAEYCEFEVIKRE